MAAPNGPAARAPTPSLGVSRSNSTAAPPAASVPPARGFTGRYKRIARQRGLAGAESLEQQLDTGVHTHTLAPSRLHAQSAHQCSFQAAQPAPLELLPNSVHNVRSPAEPQPIGRPSPVLPVQMLGQAAGFSRRLSELRVPASKQAARFSTAATPPTEPRMAASKQPAALAQVATPRTELRGPPSKQKPRVAADWALLSTLRVPASKQATRPPPPPPAATRTTKQLEPASNQGAGHSTAASRLSALLLLASKQAEVVGDSAKRVSSVMGGENRIVPLARGAKQRVVLALRQSLQRAMRETTRIAIKQTLETVVEQSIEVAVRRSVEHAVKSGMDRAVNECVERVLKKSAADTVKATVERAPSPLGDRVSTNKRSAEYIAEAPLSTAPREQKRRHLGHRRFGDGTVTAPARCVGSDQNTDATETPVHLRAGQYCVCDKVYTEIAVLDEGGSATVYRVLGPDGCEYALKRIVLTKLPNEARERAWAEVVILQKLQDCPSVIRLIGASQQEDEIHIVFELGEATLETRLRELDANPDRAVLLELWKQMLTAVRDVHAKNIIHGDLKPSNFVFVGGVLKIIDLGISVIVCDGDTNFVRGRGIGTIDYISPEALEPPHGEKSVKIRFSCDVWSLGIILFRMLFGKTPFAEFGRVWKEYYLLSPGAIEFPANGDHAIQAVLEQCLQHDQSCRPSVNSLLQQLARRVDSSCFCALLATANSLKQPGRRRSSRMLCRSALMARCFTQLCHAFVTKSSTDWRVPDQIDAGEEQMLPLPAPLSLDPSRTRVRALNGPRNISFVSPRQPSDARVRIRVLGLSRTWFTVKLEIIVGVINIPLWILFKR